MAVVLTNFGETFVVDKMDEVLAIKGDMLALGTSTAAPAKGDINLGAEVTCMGQSPGGRIQGATSQGTADILKWVGTHTMVQAKDLGEGGTFTTSSTGKELIIHGNFTAIPLSSGDQIELTVSLEVT